MFFNTTPLSGIFLELKGFIIDLGELKQKEEESDLYQSNRTLDHESIVLSRPTMKSSLQSGPHGPPHLGNLPST